MHRLHASQAVCVVPEFDIRSHLVASETGLV